VSSIEIEVWPIMCNGADINTNAASLQSWKSCMGTEELVPGKRSDSMELVAIWNW
jgi:hypothetical protein